MKKEFRLYTLDDDPDTAYLAFPDHPGRGKHGVVNRVVRVQEVLENYQSADISLDFDEQGQVIGIEILI